MTPDFEVRRLDQYPTEELEKLLEAVFTTQRQYMDDSLSAPKEFDLWLYRIQEALKNKRKEQ